MRRSVEQDGVMFWEKNLEKRTCAEWSPAAIFGGKEPLELLDKTAWKSIIAVLLLARTRFFSGLDMALASGGDG
jgi:hypothetical protein